MNLPRLFCLILPLFSLLCPATAEEEENPQHATFTLMLPHRRTMEFVLVRVCEETNPFSSVDFHMGTIPFNEKTKETSTYTNTQAYASVSGTITAAYKGQTFRAIPMARTEITREQYLAVMNADGKMPDTVTNGNFPQVELSRAEIELFLEALNRWLVRNPDIMASALKGYGAQIDTSVLHARLPQENEWEFAARGGAEVSKAIFQSGIPYPDMDSLKAHEVLAIGEGRGSICEAGSTSCCNPAGLYDMLGNVRELVDTPFRPEYHFGRVGGLLACGGNFTTDPEMANAALRTELSPVNEKDGSATRDNVTGFRIVLGSVVSTGEYQTEQRLLADWRTYREHLVAHRSGEDGGEARIEELMKDNTRQGEKVAELSKTLDAYEAQIEEAKKQKGETEQQHERDIHHLRAQHTALENALQELRAEMENTHKRLDVSQLEVARGALFLIYYSATDGVRDRELALRSDNSAAGISDERVRAQILDRAATLRANFPIYWDKFNQGCILLASLPQDIVNTAVEERRKEIKSNVDKSIKNSDDVRIQSNILECSIRIAADYAHNNRYTFLPTGITPETWIDYVATEATRPTSSRHAIKAPQGTPRHASPSSHKKHR